MSVVIPVFTGIIAFKIFKLISRYILIGKNTVKTEEKSLAELQKEAEYRRKILKGFNFLFIGMLFLALSITFINQGLKDSENFVPSKKNQISIIYKDNTQNNCYLMDGFDKNIIVYDADSKNVKVIARSEIKEINYNNKIEIPIAEE